MSKQFQPGVDRVYYAQPVYGEEEISAVLQALREGWLGPGKYTEEFEQKVASLFGKRFGLFVNSGTSANILAIKLAHLPPGSEVITQACTFPATLSPIVQEGLIPVFIDSHLGSYNIDLDQVEAAVSQKTKAIFISHAIGNVNDMRRLREICDRYKLVLIEDACDTIGCRFAGRPTGEYSDITTTSFYAAHNITTGGGGGMVMVDDPDLIQRARQMNNWGSAFPSPADEDYQTRLSTRLEDTVFDGKFTYIEQTYNFKAVEMQAAFGLAQLKKLSQFNHIRTHNFQRLYEFFSRYQNHFILPQLLPEAEVFLIAFPLTIRPESFIVRRELLTFLEERKIQTRPLFAGNILKHPAYKDIPRRVHGELKNADLIMKNSFLIGCHHGMTEEMLEYMLATFEEFLKIANIKAVERLREEINKSFDRVINMLRTS